MKFKNISGFPTNPEMPMFVSSYIDLILYIIHLKDLQSHTGQVATW